MRMASLAISFHCLSPSLTMSVSVRKCPCYKYSRGQACHLHPPTPQIKPTLSPCHSGLAANRRLLQVPEAGLNLSRFEAGRWLADKPVDKRPSIPTPRTIWWRTSGEGQAPCSPVSAVLPDDTCSRGIVIVFSQQHLAT